MTTATMVRRGFASDNNAGAHPEVLAALAAANQGHAVAYGDDAWTARATERIQAEFGREAAVFFVFGGTGANVVALASALRPYEAVICTDGAHLAVDECGAPERVVGCKILTVPSADGKLTIAGIRSHLHGIGQVHHAQPRLVSISQTTELGSVYTLAELRELCDFAHQNRLLVHLDGARLANAAAALSLPLGAFGREAGVDVLSFGGTKAGLVFGEAVVVFDAAIAAAVPWARKQTTQLPSKMRFVAAQFEALLEGDLWLRSAGHANRMAQRLAAAIANIPGVQIEHPPQANAVFATLPPAAISPLRERFFFYLWDETRHLARLMTSFDTSDQDVSEFAAYLRAQVSAVSSDPACR